MSSVIRWQGRYPNEWANLLRFSLTVVLVLAVLWNSQLGVRGQAFRASLTGIVTDESGGSIPGVTVNIQNQETGAVRTQVTTDQGFYSIQSLSPGIYSVIAEMPGFKRYEYTDLVLQVNQQARLDIMLNVGEISDSVTVTGQAQLLDSQSQERGQVIEEKRITELPLNGRNFLSLARLEPGVISSQGEWPISINGFRGTDVSYMLDGAENTDWMRMVPATRPSIDAIKEFKVVTFGYGAENGRAMGGVVSAVMKSGTNEFHGSLFEFVRNDMFDANNFFANRAGIDKPAFRMNQFGGTLGGPIIKDRTFFFVTYDGTRIRAPQIRSTIVPTAAEKAGDFSGPGFRTIHDPLNLDATGQRTPFPNNRIPDERIHPISRHYLDLWPAPNQPGSPNFVRAASSSNDEDQFIIRVDHAVSRQDNVFGRISYQRNPQFSPANLPGFGIDSVSRSYQAVINWTRNLGATGVNEVSVSGLHNRPESTPEHAGRNPNFGFPNETLIPAVQQGVPTLSIAGYEGFIGNLTSGPSTIYSIADNFSVLKGDHLFKFGVSWSHWGINDLVGGVGGVQSGYNGAFTGSLNEARTSASSGQSFADFLLGVPNTVGTGNPNRNFRTRQSLYHFYAADDWQFSPRLTLNLGLRYEVNLPYTVPDNRAAGSADFAAGILNFPQGAPLDELAGFAEAVPHRIRDNRRLFDPNYNYLAPRLGLAMRFDSKTVLRLGGGIYYGQAWGTVGRSAGWSPPWFIRITENYNTARVPTTFLGHVPAANLETLLAAGLDLKVTPPDFQTSATSYQWSMNIQREFLPGMSLDLGYTGNRAIDLYSGRNANRAVPGPGPVQPRRPVPLWTSCQCLFSDITSKYHALQVKVTRQAQAGLFFVGGYTWSKSTDRFNSTTVGGQDLTNMDADYGLSDQHLAHRFTFNTIYELPFGEGLSGIGRQLARGWQLGAILDLSSGSPFDARVNNTNFYVNTGNRTGLRADLIGDNHGNLPSSQRTIEQWFDIGAFAIPERYTWGNAGRNILFADGIVSVDFSLTRNFDFGESQRLQLRGEFFNFFNHPNFGAPRANIDQSDLGRVTSAGTARQIQFGIKYYF